MKSYLLITLSILLLASCSPHKLRKRSVVKVNLIIDSLEAIKQEGYIAMGLAIKLNNGKKKATFGYANGSWDWWRFKIKAENAIFSEGFLIYNPQEVIGQKKQIRLFIQPRNNANYTDTFNVEIPQPVKATLSVSKNEPFAPGYPIELNLSVVFNNGSRINTQNEQGKFLWNLFDIKYNGQVIKNGIIIPPNNAPAFIKIARAKTVYKYNKEIFSDLEIPLNYKASYIYNFDGGSGHTGSNGANGRGTYQGRASDGQSGGNGGAGQNGYNINVHVLRERHEDQDYLLVKIEAAGRKTEMVYINTQGGRITISNSGGKGGRGGTGGCGEYGENETEKTAAGQGGNGGNGGTGGNGGNGGNVYLYIDSTAMQYLSLLRIINGGGEGGDGGSGGASGRGGSSKGDSFLTALLGGNRGYAGNDGNSGNWGLAGNPIQITQMDRKTLGKIMGIEKNY